MPGPEQGPAQSAAGDIPVQGRVLASTAPARVLARVNRLLPRDTWERIERRRALAASAGRVPDPERGWMYREPLIIAAGKPLAAVLNIENVPDGTLVGAMPLLALWRMTRGVYQIDPALLRALATTDLDRVPTELLQRLPEYAPYIDLSEVDWPGYEMVRGNRLQGVWLTVSPTESGPSVLDMIWVYEGDQLLDSALDLTQPTLDECIQSTYARSEEQRLHLQVTREWQGLPAFSPFAEEHIQFHRQLAQLALNLALYLCSDEPDITGVVKQPQLRPRRHRAPTYEAPGRDNVVQVGCRQGGAIRRWHEEVRQRGAEGEGWGAARAPHIRRAHWAVRWTGPGREVPRLVWLAPTAVGVRDLDTLPVHVRAVPGGVGREGRA